MYIYIFAYTKFMGTKDDIRAMLRSIDVIEEVVTLFDNSFLIKSEYHANDISNKIREIHPNRRFLLTRISKERQGWLPKYLWNFIREDKG